MQRYYVDTQLKPAQPRPERKAAGSVVAVTMTSVVAVVASDYPRYCPIEEECLLCSLNCCERMFQ